jgi:hypothetical protein
MVVATGHDSSQSLTKLLVNVLPAATGWLCGSLETASNHHRMQTGSKKALRKLFRTVSNQRQSTAS